MAKDLERAVAAVQAYDGCAGKTGIKQAQRLYERARKAVEGAAKRRGMSVVDAWTQIGAEARRRGSRCPIPGKDY